MNLWGDSRARLAIEQVPRLGSTDKDDLALGSTVRRLPRRTIATNCQPAQQFWFWHIADVAVASMERNQRDERAAATAFPPR